MIKGDPGMESIYQWDATVKAESYRGASSRGDGVHILTGPIFVEDAEPGDLLKVEILDLVPRPNPAGKTFGYEQPVKEDANQLFPFILTSLLMTAPMLRLGGVIKPVSRLRKGLTLLPVPSLVRLNRTTSSSQSTNSCSTRRAGIMQSHSINLSGPK
jgi:hypothetical protein